MAFDMEKALADLDGKIDEKFKAYEGQMKESGDVSESIKADLKSLTEDFDGIKKDLMSTKDSLTAIRQGGVRLEQGEVQKSVGQQFVESEAFKAYKDGSTGKAKMEFKNTILGEGGSPQNPVDTIVPADRQAGIVPGAFRQLMIRDVIPRGATNSNTVEYTREASWTNNAAEAAEAAQKAESVLTFELVSDPVRTIAHFIKVSKQVLDDAPMLQSYIDLRMRHGVNQREEAQIIAGNGTSPNLKGLAHADNHTDLTLVTADNDLDATNRAKYQVVASDYMADLYLMNPADWGRIERKKTGISSDETYLAGQSSAISYLQNGMQPLLWGLPVLLSNSVTAGKFYCMARDATMFWDRQSVVVEIFDQNQDDVEKNLLTIRAEKRGAFGVFHPAAVIEGALPEAS